MYIITPEIHIFCHLFIVSKRNLYLEASRRCLCLDALISPSEDYLGPPQCNLVHFKSRSQQHNKN